MTATDDLLDGWESLKDARPDYDLAWSYWKSDVPEIFDSPVWRRIFARSGTNFRINASKIPIVALTDRLKVGSVVALGPGGARDEATDEILQDRIWTANRMPLQTKKLIRNTLILGDGILFVWRGDDDGSCRVAYNDPRTTRLVYDADDDLTIRYGIKAWKDQNLLRATLLYADRLERGWYCKADADPSNVKSWDRDPTVAGIDGADDAGDVPNPYNRVPLFHFRTDLPYGVPEAEDAWGAQDAIQKAASTMAYAGERAGLRDRYALTDPAAALNGDSMDNPDWDDDADADVESRDDSSMRSGPGEIGVLEGVKAVGEWSAADPKGFIDSAEWWMTAIARITRTPSRYADPGGQHPSGSSLRVADAPNDSKADDRREYIDGELKDALAFGLVVCGVPDGKVDVRWKPTGIVDDLDTWQIVDAKVRAGVPQKVAIVETGLYDADEVDAWLDQAHAELDLGRRIELLGAFAGAVAQLGQAVALNILDETQARAVVEQTVGQLSTEDLPEASPGEPQPGPDGGTPDGMPMLDGADVPAEQA